jgi:OmpA-OmpF porin, OOP family
MIHKHTWRGLALASLAPLTCAQALAQTPSPSYFYGGASLGSSRGNFDEAQIANKAAGEGTSITSVARASRRTAYRVFGGYQFNRYMAVEAGYVDLGKFSFDATTAPAGTLNGELKVIGATLDLVGSLPMGDKFSLLGRIGGNWLRTRDRFSTTGGATVSNASPSERTTHPKFGGGVQYAFTPSFLMRAEADRYRVSDATGGRGDVNVLSVSVVMPLGRGTTSAPRMAAAPYVPPPAPAPAMESMPAPAPPVAVAPPAPPAPVAPARRRVSYSAESIFGFDKSAVQPQGKAALDSFANELRGAQFDVVTVQGHTDRLGTTAYNLNLSVQRAEAVKSYLVESGAVPASKVSAQGMGESAPTTNAADCKGNRANAALIACLQPDRRVDIEVVGTR